MWGGEGQTQARVGLTDSDCRVDVKDIFEVGQGLALELTWPAIVGTELSLQALPWNQRGLLQIAHPEGEPDVEVDGEWRSLQLTDGSEIDGDGGKRDRFEEFLAQEYM